MEKKKHLSQTGESSEDFLRVASCALRGRPDMSSGTDGDRKNKQHLEMNGEDVANALTSVSKDSLVALFYDMASEWFGDYTDDGFSADGTSCNGEIRRSDLGWVRDKKGEVIKRPVVGVANCVTSGKRDNTQNYVAEFDNKDLRIRRLTERECFRLMDVGEADIDKMQTSGVSNSQQYKLAGNSIVVNVLYCIFDRLFVHTEPEDLQLKLF